MHRDTRTRSCARTYTNLSVYTCTYVTHTHGEDTKVEENERRKKKEEEEEEEEKEEEEEVEETFV